MSSVVLIAAVADKGAPGVTTSALALASAWPSERAVVVECDENGGDIALRLRRRDGEPFARTVVGLAAAARDAGLDRRLVASRAEPINDRVAVVPGHLMPEHAGGLSQQWGELAQAMRASEADVIADLGQVHLRSGSLELAVAADAVVVVARGHADAAIRLRERLRLLGQTFADRGRAAPLVWPVVVTPSRLAKPIVSDVSAMLDEARIPFESVLSIGVDPRGVQLLERGRDLSSARGPLARTARQAAKTIHSHVSMSTVGVRS